MKTNAAKYTVCDGKITSPNGRRPSSSVTAKATSLAASQTGSTPVTDAPLAPSPTEATKKDLADHTPSEDKLPRSLESHVNMVAIASQTNGTAKSTVGGYTIRGKALSAKSKCLSEVTVYKGADLVETREVTAPNCSDK